MKKKIKDCKCGEIVCNQCPFDKNSKLCFVGDSTIGEFFNKLKNTVDKISNEFNFNTEVIVNDPDLLTIEEYNFLSFAIDAEKDNIDYVFKVSDFDMKNESIVIKYKKTSQINKKERNYLISFVYGTKFKNLKSYNPNDNSTIYYLNELDL